MAQVDQAADAVPAAAVDVDPVVVADLAAVADVAQVAQAADAVPAVDVAKVDQAVDADPVADVDPVDQAEIDADVDRDVMKKIQVSSSAL